MSLDNFFDSLVANTTTANEDQDLFEKYLNLDEYDYKYSELPNPLPPVVHPTAPSSAVYSDTSYPNGSVAAPWIPNAPSTPLATPIDGSLSLLHHQATDNGICNFQAPHPASSPAQNRLNGSAPLAGASTCLFCGDSHVPRPTGLGTTSTYWNTRQATYIAGHDTVDVVTPCLDRHACMAMRPSVPLVGTTAIDTKDNVETTFGTTIAPKRHPDLVEQLQREAADVIAWYGNLFKDAAPSPNPTRSSPLQPRNSALVQRTSNAGDHNVASLPYPSARPQSKRTRVPGCYVCTWAGCNESFARKERLDRHVQSRHIHSKDHHCQYCEYACSRKDNLQVHVRNCKSRPGQLQVSAL